MRGIIIFLLMLGACAPKVVPVTPDPVRVPALPPSLDADPKPLPPIRGNDLSAVLTDTITSTRAYNALRADYIDLRRAYNCVKTSGLNSEALTACLDTNQKK